MRIYQKDVSDFPLVAAEAEVLEFNARELRVFFRAAALAAEARRLLETRHAQGTEAEALDYELARLEHAAGEFSERQAWLASGIETSFKPFTIEGP